MSGGFTPGGDAKAALSAPTVSAQSLDSMMSARGSTIFGTMDNLAVMLFNFSPLDEWVFNPFIGDWRALDKSSVAWLRAADALDLVQGNIEQLPLEIAEEWTGKASTKFAMSQMKISLLIPPLSQQCRNASNMCAELVNYCTVMGDLVLSMLETLASKLIRMSVEVAIPVAGWLAAGVEIAALVADVLTWSAKVMDMFASVLGFIEEVHAILTGIQNALGETVAVLRVVSSVTGTVGSVLGALVGELDGLFVPAP